MRLVLRTDRRGLPLAYTLVPANEHEYEPLLDLVEPGETVIADKGLWGRAYNERMDCAEVQLLTPARERTAANHGRERALAVARLTIESVFSNLKEQMRLERHLAKNTTRPRPTDRATPARAHTRHPPQHPHRPTRTRPRRLRRPLIHIKPLVDADDRGSSYLPSRISAPGWYMRRTGRKSPAGAGSQLASRVRSRRARAGGRGRASRRRRSEAGRAVADRVAVDRVGDEVVVGHVVHRQRPEGVDRRRRVERAARSGATPLSCSPGRRRRSIRSSPPRSRGCPRARRAPRPRASTYAVWPGRRSSIPARRSCRCRGGRGCSRRCAALAPAVAGSAGRLFVAASISACRRAPARRRLGQRRVGVRRTGCRPPAGRAARTVRTYSASAAGGGKSRIQARSFSQNCSSLAHAQVVRREVAGRPARRAAVRRRRIAAQRRQPGLRWSAPHGGHVGRAGDGEAADDREDVGRRRDRASCRRGRPVQSGPASRKTPSAVPVARRRCRRSCCVQASTNCIT